MPTHNRLSYISVEEYLAKEEQAIVRHEYVDGRVFAMSGVSRRHNTIAGNIISCLRVHVKGSGCRVYFSDVKVRVEATNSFYYPDVMVTCGAFDDRAVSTNNPVLLVEVLSRSTATIDRREKVLAYKKIESLKEYLIVHQMKQHVEMHRRNEAGQWDVLEFEAGTEILLESMETGQLRLTMDSIYEDVTWPHGQDWEVSEGADDDNRYAEEFDW